MMGGREMRWHTKLTVVRVIFLQNKLQCRMSIINCAHIDGNAVEIYCFHDKILHIGN